ncbi:ammonium transmembrane transporter [Malassezia pachydermatis]|uniref:Ammonium transporter n=1 Tax=Malassezia pachydermatis TaxID=77020 RepID=A0A0M9VQB7_9BASI|nr:ammonium transporter [Malassezia pachydermatis]KOS15155.1 ammonium transporter [Malassezia pachydermatis]
MVEFNYTDSNDIQIMSDGEPLVYNLGNIAWILTSTMLVCLMIPGVGFFYSGLLRRKNALSMIAMSMMVMAVASFEWFFWGFSLSFSEGASRFIGDLKHFGLMHVDMQVSMGGDKLPQLVYCIYQMMFAALTPVIACGAFADRARIGPMLIFVFCWCTIVYNPLACWTWNSNGWSYVMGGLDYAGGTPVHISSGTAALVISLYLGRRRGYGTAELAYRPHNATYVVLGTVFLWIGWFGFNGGSGIGANLRAAQAIMVTHIAACVGGLTWMLWDYRLERKWSIVGFCSGAISGLVAITPASGFVGTPSSLVFGVVGATVCNFATGLKGLLGYDDALDIFAAHAIGGITGNILTALFADNRVTSFDGTDVSDGDGSGWINHHYIQLGYQLADSCSGFGWSFVLTFILLFIIDHIPGCKFRSDERDEVIGMDISQVGEEAYAMPHYNHLEAHQPVELETLQHHEMEEKQNISVSNATSQQASFSEATPDIGLPSPPIVMPVQVPNSTA